MVLDLYLNNTLVDSLPLSLHRINDATEREGYIQGAINHLLEIWDDQVKDGDVKVDFRIRAISPNGGTNFLLS